MELKHFLPSHISVVPPFIDQVMSFITRFREVDGSEDDIELALREALLNAVIHGNAQDPYKRVYVTTRCNSDGEVSITIRDQGLGFDSRAVPDPTAPENRMCSHGRGIYLIRSLMDEVSFDEGGTVLHMRKSSTCSAIANNAEAIKLFPNRLEGDTSGQSGLHGHEEGFHSS